MVKKRLEIGRTWPLKPVQQQHLQALLLVLALLHLGLTSAESIALLNPSFEDPALAEGATSATVTGWQTTDAGILNPAPEDIPSVPHGDNVLVLNNNGVAALTVVQPVSVGQAITVYAYTVSCSFPTAAHQFTASTNHSPHTAHSFGLSLIVNPNGHSLSLSTPPSPPCLCESVRV